MVFFFDIFEWPQSIVFSCKNIDLMILMHGIRLSLGKKFSWSEVSCMKTILVWQLVEVTMNIIKVPYVHKKFSWSEVSCMKTILVWQLVEVTRNMIKVPYVHKKFSWSEVSCMKTILVWQLVEVTRNMIKAPYVHYVPFTVFVFDRIQSKNIFKDYNILLTVIFTFFFRVNVC